MAGLRLDPFDSTLWVLRAYGHSTTPDSDIYPELPCLCLVLATAPSFQTKWIFELASWMCVPAPCADSPCGTGAQVSFGLDGYCQPVLLSSLQCALLTSSAHYSLLCRGMDACMAGWAPAHEGWAQSMPSNNGVFFLPPWQLLKDFLLLSCLKKKKNHSIMNYMLTVWEQLVNYCGGNCILHSSWITGVDVCDCTAC